MLRCWLVFLLTLGLTLTGPAQARAPGPQQNISPAKVRDLQQIRTSKVLRVLVNQSRNSSGEVKGEPVGIEYYRLRALEHYLNARAADDQRIQLKLIPRAKEQLMGALARGEGDLAAPGELLDPSAVRREQQCADTRPGAVDAGRAQRRAKLQQGRAVVRAYRGLDQRQCCRAADPAG